MAGVPCFWSPIQELAMLVSLWHSARLVAQKLLGMFFAHDRSDDDLKRCSYCTDWVPSKARVCRHCHAILVDQYGL